MERKLWNRLSPILTAVCQLFDHPNVVYSDRWILLVYFWAVLHDRSTAWACDPANWPAGLAPATLPSESTMSRRLRTPRLWWALRLIGERLRSDPAAGLLKCLDAKPLPVGPCSKDPDARWGRGARSFIKGYKLYALWGRGPVPLAWEVRPVNCSESTEADRLLGRLEGGGYVLGDALYDCKRLYDIARDHEHQLIAPPKQPDRGGAHAPPHPARARCQELLGSRFGRELYALRGGIERDFGQLCSFGCGLSGLPSWVRRIHRVAMWVDAKLIFNGVRRLILQRVAA
jgi:hypothetical protein